MWIKSRGVTDGRQVYQRRADKECIVPLDEIKSKLAIVPIEVLEEVLDEQFLSITNERYLTRLEFRVRELEAKVIELELELERNRAF